MKNSVNAQEGTPDKVQTVEGTYVSRDGMVELTFQRGWKGIENDYNTGVAAIASKDGAGVKPNPDFSLPMFFLYTSKGKNSTNPIDEMLSATSANKLACQPGETRRVWLNEAIGKESMMECTFAGNPLKIKYVAVETPSNWAVAAYVSPKALFDSNSKDFGETLRTLKVFNAIDSKLPATSLIPSYPSFIISGGNVTLEVLSSSSMSEFALDQSQKRISAHLNETDNSVGVALIPIGSVVEGPYTILIDGKSADSPEILYSEPDGEPLVKMTYPKGTHDISIIGTRVVPEFSTAALGLGLIAFLVSAIVISRAKLGRFGL